MSISSMKFTGFTPIEKPKPATAVTKELIIDGKPIKFGKTVVTLDIIPTGTAEWSEEMKRVTSKYPNQVTAQSDDPDMSEEDASKMAEMREAVNFEVAARAISGWNLADDDGPIEPTLENKLDFLRTVPGSGAFASITQDEITAALGKSDKA